MAQFSMIVWSEPHPGQDDAFNAWYDNVHVKDILSIPGFTRAQRYVFAGQAITPRKYLAIYDVEAEDPDKILESFGAHAAGFTQSPAIDLSTAILSIVRKI